MDRRSFLKALVAAVLSPALPAIPVTGALPVPTVARAVTHMFIDIETLNRLGIAAAREARGVLAKSSSIDWRKRHA